MVLKHFNRKVWLIVVLLNVLAIVHVSSQNACSQSSLLVRTGWDYNTNTYFTDSQLDPYWQVTRDDDATTIEPRPAYVHIGGPTGAAYNGAINTGSATGGVNNWRCDMYAGSCVSSFPTAPCSTTLATNSIYNPAPPTGTLNQSDNPRILSYSFCINPNTNLSSVSFSFSLIADDYAKICLNGNYIGNNGCNLGCNITSGFQVGINVVSISLYNIAGSSCYAVLNGTMTTSATGTTPFTLPNCCAQFGVVTGQKFLDANGNGIHEPIENKIPNWPITLTDNIGNPVASTVTDSYGNYSFINLIPGNYVVSEGNQSGYFQTYPSQSSYALDLITTPIQGNIDFGNATACPTNFTYPSTTCLGTSFFNAAVCPNQNAIYSWNFGNGNTAVGQSASTVFGSVGSFTVTLTVTFPPWMGIAATTKTNVIQVQACCCTGTFVTNNGLANYVNTGINTYTAQTCSSMPFTLTATNCNFGTTYLWNFGDGTPNSTIQNPVHQFSAPGTYTIVLSGSAVGCSVPSQSIVVTVVNSSVVYPAIACIGPVPMSVNPCYAIGGATYTWDFGDGTSGTGLSVNHVYNSIGNYVITLFSSNGSQLPLTQNIQINNCQPPTCTNCIGSFAPDPGDYIVSLWVREDISPQPTTYNNARLRIDFTGDPTVYTFATNVLKNKVIEGWQRIEESFTIPAGATYLNMKLVNAGTVGSPDAFFDDIRIFPKDGQMKTYVYDPVTLRLSSMLDENNYATFYEYDEEGKLIRVKKETEKGVMTIQENHESLKRN